MVLIGGTSARVGISLGEERAVSLSLLFGVAVLLLCVRCDLPGVPS